MENIQDQMKELFGGSCYAYCIAWLFNGDRTIKDLTSTVLKGWYSGYIDADGFVSLPLQYINETCHTVPGIQDVVKVSLSNLADLPEGNWIVEYKKTPDAKASHFVIANKKGIVFDPSGDSVTVKVGKPFTYRKYIV